MNLLIAGRQTNWLIGDQHGKKKWNLGRRKYDQTINCVNFGPSRFSSNSRLR